MYRIRNLVEFATLSFRTVCSGDHESDRADGRAKILRTNVSRFSCVVELATKGLFSDHDTLVLKLVALSTIYDGRSHTNWSLLRY